MRILWCFIATLSLAASQPAFASPEGKAEKSPPPAKADKIVKEDPPEDDKADEKHEH